MANDTVSYRKDYHVGMTLDVSLNPAISPFTDDSQTAFLGAFEAKKAEGQGEFDMEVCLTQNQSDKADALGVKGKLAFSYGAISADARVAFAMDNIQGKLDLTMILRATQEGRVLKNNKELTKLELRKTVTDWITNAEKPLTLEQFKQKYGEYIIIGKEYGGEVLFQQTFLSSSSEDKKKIAGGLSLEFGKAGFSVKGSVEGDYSSSDIQKNTDIKTKYKISPSFNDDLINGPNGIITLLKKISNPAQNGLNASDNVDDTTKDDKYGSLAGECERKIQSLLSSKKLDCLNVIILKLDRLNCVDDAFQKQEGQMQDIQVFFEFVNPLYMTLKEMSIALNAMNVNWRNYDPEDTPKEMKTWLVGLEDTLGLMKSIHGKRIYVYSEKYYNYKNPSEEKANDGDEQKKEICKPFWKMRKTELENQFYKDITEKHEEMMERRKTQKKNKQDQEESKSEFASTKSAECIVTVTEADALQINDMALRAIRNTFGRVIALAGSPGVGKSTLSSMMYNIMRGDKVDYFEISGGMESFTKGIWALKDNIKTMKAKEDSAYGWDILDLEGLANSHEIHYLVVIAMALSDAIVVCDIGKRFNFDALDTITAAIRIYREKKINLPPPTLFLQVRYGRKKFKIDHNNKVDEDGLIAYIKQKYSELKALDIHLFATEFDDDEDDRFQDGYEQSVKSFLKDVQSIKPSNMSIEERVKYARQMVEALNNNSDEMISKLNFEFFCNQTKQIAKEQRMSAIKTVKEMAVSAGLTLTKQVSFGEFCAKIGGNGKLYYGEDVVEQVTILSFYDANDPRYTDYVDDIEDSQERHCIEAKDYCKDEHEAAMVRVKSLLLGKGDALMKINNELFDSFVNRTVHEAIAEIQFNGDTDLPQEHRLAVQTKRRDLRKEITDKTQDIMELEDDYLSLHILYTKWNVVVNALKADWEKRKTCALGANKRKVITTGNHTCGKCGKKHGNGVTDLKCQDSLYYWVDAQTKYCICDTCHKLWKAGTIVCASCYADLDARVVPIN
eukprot:227465_1